VFDPARAVPEPGARDVLRRLTEVFGTVAVISGRPAESLVALLELDAADAPPLHVLGMYGRQPWRRADPIPLPRGTGPAGAREDLLALLAAGPDRLRLEDKGESWAVHARGLPDPEAALARIRPRLLDLADRHGLRLQPGRAVLELLPPGPDKGTALRLLQGQVGARAVFWAGDDLADVLGFDALDELRARGVPALGVAVANAETTAPAARADVTVSDPAALLNLLTALADAANGP
jgi:trehalose 6-phosphate phosphatase